MDRCWPCTNRNSSANEGGTSKVSATAASVSSSIAATRSEWKVLDTSECLEVVEGLVTAAAHPQRLAGGRAEPARLAGGRGPAPPGPDPPGPAPQPPRPG